MPGVALALRREADDGAPWHDPAMPLAERMKLAEGKPLPRRMMAAMAQQDCGQCGYNCRDYSDAHLRQEGGRLNLCVPGGKETARMLKSFMRELERRRPLRRRPRPRRRQRSRRPQPGCSRDNPVDATFRVAPPLNKAGSEKETWHIELDLAGTRARLRGRRLASACIRTTIRRWSMRCLRRSARRRISRSADARLRETLIDGVSLSPAPDMLFQLFPIWPAETGARRPRRSPPGEDPDGDAATLDVLAALQKIRRDKTRSRSVRRSLEPLQPRRLFDLVLA